MNLKQSWSLRINQTQTFNKMNNIEFPMVDWPYTGDYFAH